VNGDKSVLQAAFERSPFWTTLALLAPFGMALGIVAAIVKMPRRKEGQGNETSGKPDSR
jgi:hypothetical protein